MRKRRKRVFIVLAGSVIATLWFSLSERQPSYQGKPLAYWLTLKNNDDDDAVRDEPHFEEAIRQMGTNCLPYLLRRIAYEPPAWKTGLIKISSGLRWIPVELQDDRAERLALGAEDAFRALGHSASPAIPDLARLAKDRSRGRIAHRTINALAWIGPEARPIVTDLLNDPRPDIRSCAISGLNFLGTNALPAIPRLIDCLKDPDAGVAQSAAMALGFLHLRPDLSVPALTNALQDGRLMVKEAAVSALTMFGYAVPAAVFPTAPGPRQFAARYGTTNSFQESVPQVATNASPARYY